MKKKCKSPPKPSSHSSEDRHLVDAHPKDDVYNSGHSRLLGDGSRSKETVSKTLVYRYTPFAVKREAVGTLHRQPTTEDNAMSFPKP